jgi:hypothetical protein
MAAISVSIKRGVDGFKISDFTVGTQAPNANDVELRFNTTDTNGAAVTMLDVQRALDAFERVITTTDSNVNVIAIPTL